MAITTQDGLVAALASAQMLTMNRTASRTVVAGSWTTTLDLAGNPGAGVLAGTNTTAGLVPTDAMGGCPIINPFTGANKGYITNFSFTGDRPSRLRLVDMLFKAGAYTFNANQALSSQPSYAGRVPGADYKGMEIWAEAVTAFTGNPTFTITYTNESGTTGRTATIAAGAALIVGRMVQIPLQAGDKGVQQITNVQCSVATVGTFNIYVLRPLLVVRLNLADGDILGLDSIGMPEVFDTSALVMMVSSDNTSAPSFESLITIASG